MEVPKAWAVCPLKGVGEDLGKLQEGHKRAEARPLPLAVILIADP